MKIIILAVLSYAVLLEAYPYEVFDIVGKGVGSGLGLGVGVGAGIGMKGIEAVAVGPISAIELGSHTLEGVKQAYATGLETGLALLGIGEKKAKI